MYISKIKNIWLHISYSGSKKWNSFTYIFRKRYYKVRLAHKMLRYYWGPWDACDVMTEAIMEIFCDYYEHGGIEQINWNSDKSCKKAKKKFDEVYYWWRTNRIEDIKDEERLLNLWSHYTNFMRFSKDLNEFSKEKDPPQAKLYFDLHSKKEKENKEKEIKYTKIIIALKDYLWS